MTKDKALRMTLNWLVSGNFVYPTALRTAIKEALAQSEQEPLEYWNAVEGWVKIDEVRKHFETVSCGTIYKIAGEGRVPLYTTPPKREWVDLTDKEIDAALKSCNTTDTYKYFRAIEAKLKELNS